MMYSRQPAELVKHYQRLFGREEDDFRNANLRQLVLSSLKSGSVLDVGCGTGRMSCEAYFAGHEVVVASDVEKRLLDFAKRNAKETGAKIKTTPLSIMNLNKLGESRFDNVICLDVIEHIKDDVKAVKMLNHVLKKNGRLILVTPAFKYLYGKRDVLMGHFRRYHKNDLSSLLTKNGFRIKEIRYWNLLGMLVYYYFEKIKGKRVDESIRYKPNNKMQKVTQWLIFKWVQNIENKFKFPVGLSLFVVATKK